MPPSTYFNQVYDDDHFTELKAGATILGMRLNEMLNAGSGVKPKVKALLEEEIQKEEESQLFNQIIQTNRNLKFDEVAEAIALLNNEIK